MPGYLSVFEDGVVENVAKNLDISTLVSKQTSHRLPVAHDRLKISCKRHVQKPDAAQEESKGAQDEQEEKVTYELICQYEGIPISKLPKLVTPDVVSRNAMTNTPYGKVWSTVFKLVFGD